MESLHPRFSLRFCCNCAREDLAAGIDDGLHFARVAPAEQQERVQVPIAGVEHVADLQPAVAHDALDFQHHMRELRA